MSDTKPTDAQIRGALRWHWKHEFRNWESVSIIRESVMDLSPEDATEADEREVEERAYALLKGAKITIEWADPNAEVEVLLTEWGDSEDD